MLDMVGLFTTQYFNFHNVGKLIGKIKYKSSTVITIITLIFFSFILTKSFTSLLLNTYFKLIKVPVVESLEEVLNENQCLIAGTNNTFENLKDYEVFDERQIDAMIKKKMEYKENSKIANEPGLIVGKITFNDMVRGKAIILLDSYGIEFYLKYYKKDREKFVVSEHKYINQQMNYVINKRSVIFKQQLFGFVLF